MHRTATATATAGRRRRSLVGVLRASLPPVLVLALGACGIDDTDTRSETAGLPSTRQDIEANQWVLDGAAGDPAIQTTEAVTIAFEEDGVYGSGPCNTFRGTLSIEDDTLDITDVASTMKACDPPLMQAENDWFAALDAVDHAEVDDDDRLVLRGDGVRLEFDADDTARDDEGDEGDDTAPTTEDDR